MIDKAKLREHLTASGRVTLLMLAQAEQHAASAATSPEEALLALDLADYSDIGAAMAEATCLPYVSLVPRDTAERHAYCLSPRTAAAWRVFPVSYDECEHLLTLAVHDPDQIAKLESIYRFFMMPCSLAFTVASLGEIEEVGEQTLREGGRATVGRAQSAAVRRGHPGEKPVRDEPEPPLLKLKAKSPGGRGIHLPPAFLREGEQRREPEYAAMGRAVISTLAALVRADLKDEPERLSAVEEQARHCRLLASRLDLPAGVIDAVVVCAWLLGLRENPEVWRNLSGPYDVETILLSCNGDPTEVRVEAAVLSLVRCFHRLRGSHMAVAEDVQLARRALRAQWPFAHEHGDILEIFLQALMDERFLARMGRRSGRLLIVDPGGGVASGLAGQLRDEGYEVAVATAGADASEILSDPSPDVLLVIADADIKYALALCRQVRAERRNRAVGIVALVPREQQDRSAACLRAGADDVVVMPLDVDLLLLKVHRIAGLAAEADGRGGLSGSLDDMRFTDVVQILCAGGRNMAIALTRDGREGHVFVQDGEVTHAEVGDLVGAEAFYEIMRWPDGQFTTSRCAAPPERTIQVSAMSLLMEGARLVDEGAT